MNGCFSVLHAKDMIAEESYKKFEELCKKYNGTATERFSLLSFSALNDRFTGYNADYQLFVNKKFEFIRVP